MSTINQEALEAAWVNDHEFQDDTIVSVSGDAEKGWSFEKSDGWSFWVGAEYRFEPKPGMAVRMYGKGIGFAVRGLFIDGTKIYYCTEAEERHHFKDEMYGKTASDVVTRWDAGKSIWSIEMGGFGPGYEQALQVAMIETLRFLVDGGDIEQTDGLLERLCPLGLSGAQWGAARGLAQRIFKLGPQDFVDSIPDDRKIQISNHWPSLTAPPANELVEALKEARALLIVERSNDGRIAGIGHDSKALPKLVSILDAALASAGVKP